MVKDLYLFCQVVSGKIWRSRCTSPTVCSQAPIAVGQIIHTEPRPRPDSHAIIKGLGPFIYIFVSTCNPLACVRVLIRFVNGTRVNPSVEI
jgi:hypothetical protein